MLSQLVCMVHSVMKGNFSVFQGGVPEIHYRSLVDIENEVSWFKSPKSRRLYRITKVLGIGRLCPQWAVIFINSSLMKSIQWSEGTMRIGKRCLFLFIYYLSDHLLITIIFFLSKLCKRRISYIYMPVENIWNKLGYIFQNGRILRCTHSNCPPPPQKKKQQQKNKNPNPPEIPPFWRIGSLWLSWLQAWIFSCVLFERFTFLSSATFVIFLSVFLHVPDWEDGIYSQDLNM